MRHRHRAILLFHSASLPAVAHAQASPAAAEATEKAQLGIEDIVVTAQKRSENVQDIPLAITAVSDAMLQDRQVTSVHQLSSVAPGVTFGPFGHAAPIQARGIGLEPTHPANSGRIR